MTGHVVVKRQAYRVMDLSDPKKILLVFVRIGTKLHRKI